MQALSPSMEAIKKQVLAEILVGPPMQNLLSGLDLSEDQITWVNTASLNFEGTTTILLGSLSLNRRPR